MSYRATRRDRFAHKLANAALRLATPHYRAFIAGSIEYGMRAAARDQRDGLTAPPDWRVVPPTSTASMKGRSWG